MRFLDALAPPRSLLRCRLPAIAGQRVLRIPRVDALESILLMVVLLNHVALAGTERELAAAATADVNSSVRARSRLMSPPKAGIILNPLD
jgi:hypothetical protein